MRKLMALILILGIAYFGYNFYIQSKQKTPLISTTTISSLPNLTVKNTNIDVNNLSRVLGANIESAVETGKTWLSDATGGASEPIVNRAISNFQTELMQLPAEQVEKIKYDFCKPIVIDYEKKVGNK